MPISMNKKQSFLITLFMTILLLLGVALVMMPKSAVAEMLETENYTFEIIPSIPSAPDTFFLKIEDLSCTSRVSVNRISVTDKDESGMTYGTYDVLVSLSFEDDDTPCQTSQAFYIPIPTFYNGYGYFLGEPYYIAIFDEQAATYEQENLLGALPLFLEDPNFTITPEVPAAGSIQSGVGMVRGWACDAEKIEVAFDDGDRIAVAYGTAREDARAVCGDANNGYGMVVNWGSMSKGTHRMTTFLNGDQVSEVEFSVSGLDDPFVTDLSATYQLDGFPAPDDSVTVRWSEAHQNFIIIEQN